jgi:transcriptional regulator with XRE-family HTH domain
MPKKAEPTGFASRLKELRENAGLTQDELAQRAGLYKFSVAKLEQGVREPVWSTVLALARALGVNCLAFTDEETSDEEQRKKGQTTAVVKPKRGRLSG